MIQLQYLLFADNYLKRDKFETTTSFVASIARAVEDANRYSCTRCGHKGPLDPFPRFDERENDLKQYICTRTPEQLLADELTCYNTKTNLKDGSLGVGVSVSRLPRTGEIRSVTPSLDLLSLKAFTKQKIRKSMDGEKFTHFLPLFFGENEPYTKEWEEWNEDKKEYELKTQKINPRERIETLLRKSMAFLTKKDTRQQFTPEMVVEVMPRLMTTILVDLVSDKHHFSLVAIRRLFNFIRLFRLLIQMQPDAMNIIDARLAEFKDKEDKRVKDFCSNLGDILAFSIISDKFNLEDILDAYLEEQLDRQAFWIIKEIPELDHTDEKNKGKNIIIEAERNNICF